MCRRLPVALAALTLSVSAVAADEPIEDLAKVLEGQVSRWELVRLDESTLADLAAGKVGLPVAEPGGAVVNVGWSSSAVQLRERGVETGFLRNGDRYEEVRLPPENAYRVGGCSDSDPWCGSVTIIDDRRVWVHAMLLDPELGTSFLEPVDQLLGTDSYPGLHVLYNTVDTPDIEVDGLEMCAHDDYDCGPDRDDEEDPPNLDEPPPPPIFTARATNIVLDGDATFFAIDPATWAQRQLAMFNDLSVIYEVVEPLSVEVPETARWLLDLRVKGQEVWTAGGPNQTDPQALVDNIAHPNYFLLNPVTDDEIHVLFVGYDVTGVFGQAAGIGTASGGIGGAAGLNHVFVEALTTQTAKTHWVVLTHEVGHLIGGTHALGSANSCSFFLGFIPICGVDLMSAGSAGAPDVRAPYFTDANDARIELLLRNNL